MKLFKYNQFINESNEYIDSICKEYGIRNYTINFDGSIDVDGDVHLYKKNLTKLPIKFNYVSCFFDCSDNKLTSLIGAPKSVGGFFDCSDNKLTSLIGAPKSVGGYFNCYGNELTSLIGGPEYVGGDYYYCYNNQLTDFYGFPEDWEGYINFQGNLCENILSIFTADKWCRAIDLLNEFDVIQGTKIFEVRMEEVYRQLKLKFPENLGILGYDIL